MKRWWRFNGGIVKLVAILAIGIGALLYVDHCQRIDVTTSTVTLPDGTAATLYESRSLRHMLERVASDCPHGYDALQTDATRRDTHSAVVVSTGKGGTVAVPYTSTATEHHMIVRCGS